MKEYKWENESNYIAIESAFSVDTNKHVFIVASSLSFNELPIEFRKQFPHSHINDCESLFIQVKQWAEKNGYE